MLKKVLIISIFVGIVMPLAEQRQASANININFFIGVNYDADSILLAGGDPFKVFDDFWVRFDNTAIGGQGGGGELPGMGLQTWHNINGGTNLHFDPFDNVGFATVTTGMYLGYISFVTTNTIHIEVLQGTFLGNPMPFEPTNASSNTNIYLVPEPATLSLLTLGGLALLKRRKV